MDVQRIRAHTDAVWDDSILPALAEYIEIPAKSPAFDADWEVHGHIDRGIDLIAGWCRDRGVEGMSLEVVRLPGRTPVILMEIPGASDRTVLLYGHMDKQPEMTGWREDLGPWKAVREGDRLYGRGGADDGYAAFASLAAVEALHAAGEEHARAVILIEASEESGSPDLPAYMEHLADRIGSPDLVVCLDSGAGDYERLWCTTSLRGIVVGDLHVDIVTEGLHSGGAGGIVPDTFRILRHLLDRIEDPATGEIRVPEFHRPVPGDRMEQIRALTGILGSNIHEDFPFVDGARPAADDLVELVLNNTWRPNLAVVAAEGFPSLADAGNVLRPHSAFGLSLRLAPGVDAVAALARLKDILEADPPYGARVRFEPHGPGSGWNAPRLAPWLEEAMDAASRNQFGNGCAFLGEGGSIPFMHMLGERYPEAQFLITGVLGPQSNAHGPNEFLHVPAARALTACVAEVLAAHHRVTSAAGSPS